jgi:flavin reductase (DIM6/NTAB) family NADH-FMN oxidoreductase RutF
MAGSHNATPETLEHDLEVGPEDIKEREFYQLMTGMIIPRPIGWISTLSEQGVANVSPYSYFNLMGSDPFYCAFGSTGEKDNVSNLRRIPEFVVNIVSMDLIEQMNFSSGDFPHEESEFAWAGLTKVPSLKVRPPRVGEARAHLECKVMQIVDDNNTHIVLARIVHAHVSKTVWKNGRIDPRLLDPACRLSGSAYAQLGEIVNVARPTWKETKGSTGQEKMPRIVRRG